MTRGNVYTDMKWLSQHLSYFDFHAVVLIRVEYLSISEAYTNNWGLLYLAFNLWKLFL